MFNFQLTLAEANMILAALGKQPFNDVAAIIGNIRQQAEPQLARVQAEMEAQAAEQKVADGAQEAGQEAV